MRVRVRLFSAPMENFQYHDACKWEKEMQSCFLIGAVFHASLPWFFGGARRNAASFARIGMETQARIVGDQHGTSSVEE